MTWVEQPLPTIGEGQVLIKNKLVSVDPTHRIYLTNRDSYLPKFAVGGPIAALVIGEVIQSKSPLVKEGDMVSAFGSWASHTVSPGKNRKREKKIVFPSDDRIVNLSYH